MNGVRRWQGASFSKIKIAGSLSISQHEDSLFRHYSLSLADRLEIELRRRNHNRLGFAIQLCLMRYPGRVLGAEETPPRAMLKYIADQIGAAPDDFALYARREKPGAIIWRG